MSNLILDRPALIDRCLAALAADSTILWPAAVAQTPDGAGGEPSSTFRPYIVIDPQTTTYTASMVNSNEHDDTPLQLRCVSHLPEDTSLVGRSSVIAQRASIALITARRRGDLDTPGVQKVIRCKIDTANGPFRDPDDDRIYVTHLFVRFRTARS